MMMEINEIRSNLEKSSKRAGLLTMIGVAFGIAALVFSFYYLNKQYEKLQNLNAEIAEKETREKELDQRLLEKQLKLDATEKTFATFQDEVKDKDPVAANDAITKTIESNPLANQVLLDVTSKSAAPGTVPPPKGARVAFCPEDDVRIRDRDDLNSNVVGKLQKGQTIYVTDFSQNTAEWKGRRARWAKIQTEKGLQGWVLGAFVSYSRDTPVAEKEPEAEVPGQGRPAKPPINRPIETRPNRTAGNYQP
jgi:uncharacterized protein YgiM (DUF1202 family)